jgi:membrane associated rhomboid family serine protease
MSNIHRIGDYENDRNTGANRSNVPLLGSGLGNSGNPRKESFFTFLKNFCCPLSTIKSVIFCITVLDLIVYVITLFFGITASTPNNPSLLAPLPETLDNFGSLNPRLLRQYQLWRWFTYAFLHADFVHVLSNVLSQIIIGSFIERIIGPWKISILYFATTYL